MGHYAQERFHLPVYHREAEYINEPANLSSPETIDYWPLSLTHRYDTQIWTTEISPSTGCLLYSAQSPISVFKENKYNYTACTKFSPDVPQIFLSNTVNPTELVQMYCG